MSDLRIIELRARNVLRLKAVTVHPDGSLVIIGGRNDQGKSSTLRSIEILLAGTGAMPAVPVRRGADEASIFADLGEITVERTISPKGTKLVVRNAEGKAQTSPQKILDALFSKLTFDPLAFSEMDPPKQDAVLKQILGLDFTQLDADKARIYEQRTELNKAVKQHEARRDGLTLHTDAPAEEVSIDGLREEMAEAARVTRENNDKRSPVEELKRDRDVATREHARLVQDLEELRARVENSASELKTLQNRYGAESAKIAGLVDPDKQAIIDRLANAQEINRKVRENAERATSEAAAKEARKSSEACTEAINEIEQQKADMLAAAKFPVPGLSFGDAGPMLDGFPLDQVSDSQRLRLSVAIGFALNPKLKVLLVRNGERLDDDGMRLLAQLAEEAGGQVWLERVGDKDPSAVIIEDGEVREDAAAAE